MPITRATAAKASRKSRPAPAPTQRNDRGKIARGSSRVKKTKKVPGLTANGLPKRHYTDGVQVLEEVSKRNVAGTRKPALEHVPVTKSQKYSTDIAEDASTGPVELRAQHVLSVPREPMELNNILSAPSLISDLTA